MNVPPYADQLFIDGAWHPASGGTLPLENPSTGEPIGRIAAAQAADVDEAVNAARKALDGQWGALTAVDRGRLLSGIGRRVAEQVDLLAGLEALDVGKPLKQARADALALARYLEFYGGSADKFHGETIPYLGDYTVYTLREPHGVTAHIIPWNYPMQIIGRTIGGALTMGNTCVLKPGEEASLTSLKIGDLSLKAGFPPGVLNIVPGLGEEAGEALLKHPGVSHYSFTGSTEVGVKVQQEAAKRAVPVTLELGGKSPQLVFSDADIDKALPFLVNAAIQNAGQTCSAATRVLIEKTIFQELTERLAKGISSLRSGPALQDLECGPLISKVQKDRVEGFLQRARQDGVEFLAEGSIVEDAPQGGNYVAPCMVGSVPPKHTLAQDEVFGPLLVTMPFEGEEEGIELANNTVYGLVSGVWTKDGGRQLRVARRLKSGQVFINNYGAGGGVELPFGGVKLSGHGREKGFEALYGFSVTKTVAIHHGAS